MEFPTKEQFAEWLSTKEPLDPVGVSCDMHRCPIATYLREAGASNPYVRPDKIARASCWRADDDGTNRAPLPEWANAFANMLDRMDDGADEPVNAGHARAILAAQKGR